jgi:hypothetical protein
MCRFKNEIANDTNSTTYRHKLTKGNKKDANETYNKYTNTKH